MPTFLISHTTDKGTNPAQAVIDARSESSAREKFEQQYPGRTLVTVGKKGEK